MTTFINVADGRRVAVDEFGDAQGRPVVYLHGAGTSLLEAVLFADAAKARGLRLIAIDRPGAGESTPDPNGSIRDHVADVLAVADAFGLDRFVLAGASGGTMYGAGLAVLHPERVEQFVAVVPVLPLRVRAVRRAAPRKVKVLSRLARVTPKPLAALLGSQFKKLTTAEGVVTTLHKAKDPDAEFLVGDAAANLAGAARRGLMQGAAFAVRDFALLGSDWGFDPLAITVPTTVVVGASDPLRPVGELYAHRLGAPLIQVAGGHLGGHSAAGAVAVTEAMAAATTR